MSIESEFKKFVGIAERIAVALESREVAIPKPVVEVIEEESKGDTLDKLAVKAILDTVEDEDADKDDGFKDDNIAGDGVVTPLEETKEEEQPETVKLTADVVKNEARILVDTFSEDRKGYKKAKAILKKLGADELDALVPEKYADAVNAFRKVVKLWS